MAKRKAGRATGRSKSSRRAKAKPARRVRATARRKAPATRVARRKTSPKKARLRKGRVATRPDQPVLAKRSANRRTASAGQARKAVARKVPALNRERRIARDEDIVPTPPSSLDLDRSASAARSGRRELSEKLHEHTETSPAITGGDIDADWESAYSVGDEAPGGDNPTPDQDIVDDIGKALGVQYEDNEELKGEKKISDRDRKRWELDPASAEDYNEHDED
jgi:uncharacterized protein DUF6335